MFWQEGFKEVNNDFGLHALLLFKPDTPMLILTVSNLSQEDF
ncbi:hypothetical protein ADU37_CDS11450 [Thermococcus sp. 2319x1]|nr:hypothetical protein ADU37_CDS11450 [Thermococcus sp. 2319x1]